MTLLSNIIDNFDSNDNSSSIMICGGSIDNSNITRSIAFTLAYELAELNEAPLYICSDNISTNFPDYITNDDDDPTTSHWNLSILSRISMKYCNSYKELKQVLVSLHAFHPSPSVIIIDNLINTTTTTTTTSSMSDILSILSYIDDSMTYVTPKTNNNIKLIIADSTDRQFTPLYYRVVKYLLRLTEASSPSPPPPSSSGRGIASSSPRHTRPLSLTIETEQQRHSKFIQYVHKK